MPGRGIECLYATVGIPGEEKVRLAVDIARGRMGAQHPLATGAVHEEGVFDVAGTLHGHLPDQVLAATIVRRFHGRHVEHTKQFPQGSYTGAAEQVRPIKAARK